MAKQKITIPQARKLLGASGEALNDAQIVKLLDLLANLADYSLSFARNNVIPPSNTLGSKNNKISVIP